ncbi:MAG: type II toxin-antitoxin system VapC family toxin [Chloroflexi bacterium]|nr:MAG: type II toxin-antitoxin system VapC family toxin [Chloroflexota bacterium]
MEALLDTSVLVGPEPASHAIPDDSAISVVTLAELRVGVLMASDVEERARRLARLSDVQLRFAALPVDDEVTQAYAQVVAAAQRRGVRPRPFDALIAATALSQGVPVYARDHDFLKLPRVRVVIVT